MQSSYLWGINLVRLRVWLSLAIGLILVGEIRCSADNATSSKSESVKTKVTDNFTGSYRSRWGNTLEITQKGTQINFSISVSEGNGDRVGEASGKFVFHGNKAVCSSSDNPDGKFEFTLSSNKITVVDKGECFASGVHGDGVYLKQRKRNNK